MNPSAQPAQPNQPSSPPVSGNTPPASDPGVKTEEYANIPVQQAPDSQPTRADSNIAVDGENSAQPQAKPAENKSDKDPKDVKHPTDVAVKKPKKPRGPALIIFVVVIITIALAAVAYSTFKKG